jgi:hypothetical protein
MEKALSKQIVFPAEIVLMLAQQVQSVKSSHSKF